MFLAINPIAFSIGPLSVRWYGIILGTAALIGLVLAIQEGKRFKMSPDFFYGLGPDRSAVGYHWRKDLLCSFQWDDYKDNLWDVFKIWEGGIAIYGALIGAIAAAFFYVRRKGYSFWRIADICAPG